MLLTNDRLWVGTGNGIILSVPLVSARPSREGENSVNEPGTSMELKKRQGDGIEALFMPYCAMVRHFKYVLTNQNFDNLIQNL